MIDVIVNEPPPRSLIAFSTAYSRCAKSRQLRSSSLSALKEFKAIFRYL